MSSLCLVRGHFHFNLLFGSLIWVSLSLSVLFPVNQFVFVDNLAGDCFAKPYNIQILYAILDLRW